MSLQILKEMLEDADLFGMIKAGSDAAIYDKVAMRVFPLLMKDLTISQIEGLLWDGFYEDFCVCTTDDKNVPWVLDKRQASSIIGHPSRFKGLALNIRQDIIGL